MDTHSVLRPATVIIYRTGDSASEELADYYLTAYQLDSTHKISVPCSTSEILNSYSDFQTQVENPLRTAIAGLGYTVYVIVLGYNVPGGFRDGDDIIASTSRIARMDHSYSKQKRNPLYDKKNLTRYNTDSRQIALITGRIDAPSLDEAKGIVDSGQLLRRQSEANGRFFFDPYSSLAGNQASDEIVVWKFF